MFCKYQVATQTSGGRDGADDEDDDVFDVVDSRGCFSVCFD